MDYYVLGYPGANDVPVRGRYHLSEVAQTLSVSLLVYHSSPTRDIYLCPFRSPSKLGNSVLNESRTLLVAINIIYWVPYVQSKSTEFVPHVQ